MNRGAKPHALHRRQSRRTLGVVLAVAGLSLAAACGSSSSSGTSAAATHPATVTPANSQTTAAQVATAPPLPSTPTPSPSPPPSPILSATISVHQNGYKFTLHASGYPVGPLTTSQNHPFVTQASFSVRGTATITNDSDFDPVDGSAVPAVNFGMAYPANSALCSIAMYNDIVLTPYHHYCLLQVTSNGYEPNPLGQGQSGVFHGGNITIQSIPNRQASAIEHTLENPAYYVVYTNAQSLECTGFDGFGAPIVASYPKGLGGHCLLGDDTPPPG